MLAVAIGSKIKEMALKIIHKTDKSLILAKQEAYNMLSESKRCLRRASRQDRPVDSQRLPRNLMKCLLSTDSSISSQTSSSIGRVLIANTLVVLVQATLSIGKECTQLVRVQFKKKRDKGS